MEGKVTGFFYARHIDGLCSYLCHRDFIMTFHDSVALGVRELKHLVDQTGDALGVLRDFLSDFLKRGFIIVCTRRGEHLGESRKNVERCAYLV